MSFDDETSKQVHSNADLSEPELSVVGLSTVSSATF